ncbi:MAG: L-serine ammonia-lyase, iron-sulfur-dependent, subunit alpha [Victivallales bacterium]|nr:L-serine ammonia-lyase, iron-sulfur-dependent, subunit alpha [Victivallales bacterium]MCF7888788.1 L-serine ammonia-lyase, iron-sulfur-dependent, subunit alpha [Victivallales bacterium]
MKSIRNLFKIGHGPSSSHTMGPARAASIALKNAPEAESFRVTLFGSLAATGKGHLTDEAIRKKLSPKKVEFIWKSDEEPNNQPCSLLFEALDQNGKIINSYRDASIGGGALSSDGGLEEVYQWNNMDDILEHCNKTGAPVWGCVEEVEGSEIWDYLEEVRTAMVSSITAGLETGGIIPGGLGLYRKASSFNRKSKMFTGFCKVNTLLASYAYAVAEENACGGVVVTAPTCGSSGVVPASLYLLRHELVQCSVNEVLRALATAGLIGNIVKKNASIAGSVVGCQGEIGVACAMAAAAVTQILGGSPRQIEYAAEVGLEHHLGLTCDPVRGLVQIPCIERNAHAAASAMICANFAMRSDGSHRISFDDCIQVMYETGKALPALYRETSTGGLAQIYEKHLNRDKELL